MTDDDVGLGDASPSAFLDVVHSPSSPMPNARLFVAARYTDGAEKTLLLYVHGTFYGWAAGRWVEIEPNGLRSELYEAFEGAIWYTEHDPPKVKDFQPNIGKIGELVDALRAVTFKPKTVAAPCWVDGDGTPPADELIACGNGLLHVPTRQLYAHTPAFFNLQRVPSDYDPSVPTPTRWLAFLNMLWPDDPEAIACLQEWLGYLISGDTSLQKMLLLVGPKRSGKGTIARVAKRLIGPHHVVGSTLSSLGTNFGLAPLVNAAVTFISDARLPKGDSSIITERLLSISGEDTLTVDRKYRDHWTGKLPTRIVVLTNELPQLSDTSGALASRFIVLTITRSFYGRENPVPSRPRSRHRPFRPGVRIGRSEVARRGDGTLPRHAPAPSLSSSSAACAFGYVYAPAPPRRVRHT